MTAFTTFERKTSPNWMSCGFSSELVEKFGSTIENEGSLPFAQSV